MYSDISWIYKFTWPCSTNKNYYAIKAIACLFLMDLVIRFKNIFADFFLRILTILNDEWSFLVSKPLKNVSCVETESFDL